MEYSAEQDEYLCYFAAELAAASPGTPEHQEAWKTLIAGVAICLEKSGEGQVVDRMNEWVNKYRSRGARAAGRQEPLEDIAFTSGEWQKYLSDSESIHATEVLSESVDTLWILHALKLSLCLPRLYQD